ncbi:hypothetical protein GCM10007389_00430 [Pontibacter akesuensis]|nr:hypothetical protein GCM10007389_00430 [Pontibacter akesuensis]
MLILVQSTYNIAHAQTEGLFDTYTVVPNATLISAGCVQITKIREYKQAGSAWNNTAINLNNSFDFTFETQQCGGADGMLFILQNDGLSALGGRVDLATQEALGGDLGYYFSPDGTFDQSLGVELDIWNNGGWNITNGYWDKSGSHMALVKNGSPRPLPLTSTTVAYAEVDPKLSTPTACPSRLLRVTWNSATKVMEVYLDGILRFSYVDDVVAKIFGGNPIVYFGFAGATGASTSTQTFCNRGLYYKSVAITELSSRSYCAGATIEVPVTTTGSFGSDNLFTAQLSDAAGSFTTPITLGQLNSASPGIIQGIVPQGTPAGTGYKVRVVSSELSSEGIVYEHNLTINGLSTVAAISGDGAVCVGYTMRLSNETAGGKWSSDDLSIATVNEITGEVTGVSAGNVNINYTVSNSSNTGCETSVSKAIAVQTLDEGKIMAFDKSNAPATTVAIGTAIAPSSSQYSLANSNATSFEWAVTYSENGNPISITAKGGSVTPSGSSSAGTVTVIWPTDEARIYKITATYRNSCIKTTEILVAVYDPNGGFVTGGGWFDSPSGAYTPGNTTDEDLIGNANFAFVSKYRKGSSTPEGNTEFQFNAGNLRFKSSAYAKESLVVGGAKAKYSGKGTVASEPGIEYYFFVSVIDGDINNTGKDRFRIKIWRMVDNGEVVLYDNNSGAGTDEDPSIERTAIGGGSIMIHEVKKVSTGVVAKNLSISGSALPEAAGLHNYPNPSVGATTIAFTVEKEENFTLEVYDMRGSLVRKIATGKAEAGKYYEYEFNSSKMADGVYLARLVTSSRTQSHKMIIKN